MKLLRYGLPGKEQPGVLDQNGQIRSLQGIVSDLAGAALSAASIAKLRALDLAKLPVVEPGTRIGPCVAQVGKLMGIGLNYADHAAETGATLPKEPVLFMKATSSINGPHDDVRV